MNKMILTLVAAAFFGTLSAQLPGNTPPGTTPMPPPTPGQPADNGTNVYGLPNQTNPGASPGAINTYSPAIPNSSNSNTTYSTTPGTTLPDGSYTTPGATPNTYTPKINRLFQDPSKTPGDPKQVDPVRMQSGSTGKYHKPKKAMSGKTFVHNKTGVKKAKKRNDSGRENTNSSATASAPNTTR